MEHENRELVRLDRIEPSETPLRQPAGREAGRGGAACSGTRPTSPNCSTSGRRTTSPNERLFRLGAAVVDGARPGRDRSTRWRGTSSTGCCGSRASIRRSTGVRAAGAVLDGGAVLVVGGARVCLRRDARGRAPRLSRGRAGVSARRWRRGRPADVAGQPVRRPARCGNWNRRITQLIAMHLEKTLRSARVVKELETRTRDVSGPHLQTLRLLGGAGLPHPAAARHRDGRRHDASRDVPAGARPAALERRLRAAVAAAGRRPVRREPEPAVQAPSVPGHPQAGARRRAGPLSAEPRGVRHRPARARRAVRGGQLGVADARRLGHRLAGAVRRPGNHAVHLLPAGRRPWTCRRSRSS